MVSLKTPDDRIPQSVVDMCLRFPGPFRASLGIAQWCEESGWGKSDLVTLANNWCGMKPSKSHDLQRWESGTITIGRVTYASYDSLEDCARDRQATLVAYNVATERQAMKIWCPDEGYYDRLNEIRRPWAIQVDAAWMRRRSGVDEMRKVIEALTGWSRGPYGAVLDMLLSIPQWVHEAERSGGESEAKLRYVTDRVYSVIDDALGIPWYLDGLAKGWISRVVGYVITRLNAAIGKDWVEDPIPF